MKGTLLYSLKASFLTERIQAPQPLLFSEWQLRMMLPAREGAPFSWRSPLSQVCAHLCSALSPEVVAVGRLPGRYFTSDDWREWSRGVKIGTHGHRDGFCQYRDGWCRKGLWSLQERLENTGGQALLSLAHMKSTSQRKSGSAELCQAPSEFLSHYKGSLRTQIVLQTLALDLHRSINRSFTNLTTYQVFDLRPIT